MECRWKKAGVIRLMLNFGLRTKVTASRIGFPIALRLRRKERRESTAVRGAIDVRGRMVSFEARGADPGKRKATFVLDWSDLSREPDRASRREGGKALCRCFEG